jgi:hypothetical protein
MGKSSREEQETAMRELTDIMWYGAFDTYGELEETVDEELAKHGITSCEFEEFIERRKVERSLEQVGATGILLQDLADYLRLPQQDLLGPLKRVGAVKGEDGRFRLPGDLAGRSQGHQDYIKRHLRSIGAMLDENGLLHRPGECAHFKRRSSSNRRCLVKERRRFLGELLHDAGAAGFSLEELAQRLHCPQQKVLEHLEKMDVGKGQDGRFRGRHY